MNRTRTFTTSLFLAAALSACAPDAATRYEDAQEAFAQNDFRSARVSLIAALKDEPGNWDMRLLLARAQLALGDGEGAAASLAELPEGDILAPDVALVLGEAEVLRGRYAEAIDVVAGIDTAAADRIRALAYIGQEDVAKAAEAFAAGEARQGSDAGLLASYARFELARGDVERAGLLASQAIEANPKLVEGHIVRALVERREGVLQTALLAYERALKLHPSNIDARLGKAQVLAALGRYGDASALAEGLGDELEGEAQLAFLEARIAAGRGEWEQVRKLLQPREGELRSERGLTALYGRSLIELGQPALALGVLQPELARSPGSRHVRLLVAKAQLAGKDAAGALATIRPLADRPDATPEELGLAATAARRGGSPAAQGFARRADRPSPEWIGGELAKADRALRNRQWADAEQGYEAIVARVEGENAMVLNNLAFAKEKLGKQDQALKLALRAAELDPQNASILDTAGWLLVQTGSRERGVAMLRKAARLAPDNPTIERHLAEASKS